MELPLSVALVVLAGGRGRRLGGVVKPLLRREDGRSLLDHTLERFAPLVDATFVVAPAPLHATLGAATTAKLFADPGEGPAAALVAAARAVEASRLLLVGGDLVDPPVEVARALLACVDAGAAAAVGSHAGMRQSMISVFDRNALLELEAPPRAMHRLLDALNAEVVELSAPIADVDAPEDLARHALTPP